MSDKSFFDENSSGWCGVVVVYLSKNLSWDAFIMNLGIIQLKCASLIFIKYKVFLDMRINSFKI